MRVFFSQLICDSGISHILSLFRFISFTLKMSLKSNFAHTFIAQCNIFAQYGLIFVFSLFLSLWYECVCGYFHISPHIAQCECYCNNKIWVVIDRESTDYIISFEVRTICFRKFKCVN